MVLFPVLETSVSRLTDSSLENSDWSASSIPSPWTERAFFHVCKRFFHGSVRRYTSTCSSPLRSAVPWTGLLCLPWPLNTDTNIDRELGLVLVLLLVSLASHGLRVSLDLSTVWEQRSSEDSVGPLFSIAQSSCLACPLHGS